MMLATYSKVIAKRHLSSGVNTMKSLVKLSAESLLKLASENSPLCFRLRNAVNTQSNTIAVVCDLDEVEMLLKVAKEVLPPTLYHKSNKRSDSLGYPNST